MRSGKFRKNIHGCDLREIVREITLIQRLQAEQKRIILESVFIGFEDEYSFKIRIDAQRIQ